VESVDALSRLLLAEAENTVLVAGVGVRQWHLSEASGKAFNRLVLLALNVVELEPGIDVLLVVRIKSNEVAPLALSVHIIRHNLTRIKLRVAVEDLDGGLVGLGDIHVVDTALANDTDLVVADPAPEHNLISDLALLKGRRASGHVEDLF
jgi:hypothetical protein